jgi:hypothetical protein
MTLVPQLPASVLRHLLAAAEMREDCRRVRDAQACANELAQLAEADQRPALGFWRRHLIPRWETAS